MARRSKRPPHLRVVDEKPVPGGTVLTRSDGVQRFVPTALGTVPPITYTREKPRSGKLQGKVQSHKPV